MTIFAVLAPTDRADLAAAVASVFAGNFIKIGPGQWLVSAPVGLTTQEVTVKLGAAKGEKGEIMVLGVVSYWGWHGTNIWEWIQAKAAQHG